MACFVGSFSFERHIIFSMDVFVCAETGLVKFSLLKIYCSKRIKARPFSRPAMGETTRAIEPGKTQNVIAPLMTWYAKNGRHDLPWRKTRDPYRVLVSELMLQQTQVPRVAPKYEAFLAQFPTIDHLAKATRTDVLRAWQGLGYNGRAVRLHALAKLVAESGSRLPRTEEELRKLPGIGPYTAGAIMIFAYEKNAKSVDVNVERVLRRLFFSPKERPERKALELLAHEMIAESGKPHDWQSALMDFGSAICTAKKPACERCPVREACKSKGVRPDEIRDKPKQSKFEGSNRWWRGQILRLLLQGPAVPESLAERIVSQPTDEQRLACASAISGLTGEGIIVRSRDTIRLTE
jgi:A/G-specific adenine glycosylase